MIPGGLVTIACMPIVGIMLRKGVNAKFLVALGFAIFFLYNYILMHFNTNSSHTDFFFPLIVREFWYEPVICSAYNHCTKRHTTLQEIAQGTAMNNMMRQLGGAFGIALMGTILQQSYNVSLQPGYWKTIHLTMQDLYHKRMLSLQDLRLKDIQQGLRNKWPTQ